jgi:hypothetical protein
MMYQTRFIAVRYKNPCCHINTKIFKSIYLQKTTFNMLFNCLFFLTKCFIFQLHVYQAQGLGGYDI